MRLQIQIQRSGNLIRLIRNRRRDLSLNGIPKRHLLFRKTRNVHDGAMGISGRIGDHVNIHSAALPVDVAQTVRNSRNRVVHQAASIRSQPHHNVHRAEYTRDRKVRGPTESSAAGANRRPLPIVFLSGGIFQFAPQFIGFRRNPFVTSRIIRQPERFDRCITQHDRTRTRSTIPPFPTGGASSPAYSAGPVHCTRRHPGKTIFPSRTEAFSIRVSGSHPSNPYPRLKRHPLGSVECP